MTSRFRTNWPQDGDTKTTSSSHEDSSRRNNNNNNKNNKNRHIDRKCIMDEYNHAHEDTGIFEITHECERKSIFRDRSIEPRNGKFRDKSDPGSSMSRRYVENCVSQEDTREDKACASYRHRRIHEDYEAREQSVERNDTEDCPRRERRRSIGRKDTRDFAIISTGQESRVGEAKEKDVSSHETGKGATAWPTSATRNGNSSSMSPRTESNGSPTKQVKRNDGEPTRLDRYRDIGDSLTRARRPYATDETATSRFNLGNLCSNDNVTDRFAEATIASKRDGVPRDPISTRYDDFRETIDRGIGDWKIGTRQNRDRSQSPMILPNPSNGDSCERRHASGKQNGKIDARLYSPGRRVPDDEEFRASRSRDRNSGRHLGVRSSEREDNGATTNGHCDSSGGRAQRREKHGHAESSGTLRSAVRRVQDNDEDGEDLSRTNRGHAENGAISGRYTDQESLSRVRKPLVARKGHSRRVPSPELFDVRIHRYERASLRSARGDLPRKSTFKGHDGSDLSRKSSFEDHRSRDPETLVKNNYKLRERGSSEDRDPESVGRDKSRCRDTETAWKSSGRSLTDTGHFVDNVNNNIDSVVDDHKNGSHPRDRSLSSRRDDGAFTRRGTPRCNVDEDIDDDKNHGTSRIRKDRHSRPLTPPSLIDEEHDPPVRDYRPSRISSTSSSFSSTSSKELPSREMNELARNCVQDHADCRRKSRHDASPTTSATNRTQQEFTFAPRRIATSSFEDARQDPARSQRVRSTRDPNSVNDNEDIPADRENLSFSTTERNGTTVIRIRTSSRSPVAQNEPRATRRRATRDTSATMRYRKYEDEAEDEDDDEDETFARDHRRREYRHGPRRLWTNRDGGVQITDLDEGQPCLHCGETCPGFSPHSWRKNCTSCKCPREAHDVCHEEWVSVRARLGLKGEGSNHHVGFDPRDRGLTWAPPGLRPNKAEEYFSMLPEISVPRIGTAGERHRDRQLATQLPKQDLARAYCRHLDPQHSASADDFMAARNEIALDIGSVKELYERGQKCGVCHEPLKYESLVVSASKLGLLYHPSCFQCTQCRELLVDLAYCVHDDALYCERHYAEQLKPRCAACDELIFSGEYTKAMNKDWHSGHFCCWQCDESLTGQRYVLRDEHPYCIKCYESVFANGCEECNKIIGIDSKDLSYKDKHWHEACFLCNKCRVSLVDKQFGSKVDKIYCGNCYDAQFASRCDGCGEIFRAGTKKMEYKTRQWHEKCFCCVVCRNPIGTKSFIPREQEIYCAGCYEDKFATRCVKCNKIITSGGVTYKNEPWHRDCFTCSNCNNSLAGQRFTSRDDKPYCAECFGELFAKRCTACTKPITGIGGTRFISFEDRHWHNNCFICAGCNTSLVGRGFITDGDDIICPECAKQKLSE